MKAIGQVVRKICRLIDVTQISSKIDVVFKKIYILNVLSQLRILLRPFDTLNAFLQCWRVILVLFAITAAIFHSKMVFLRKIESKIRIKSHPMSNDHSFESEWPAKSTCKDEFYTKQSWWKITSWCQHLLFNELLTRFLAGFTKIGISSELIVQLPPFSNPITLG